MDTPLPWPMRRALDLAAQAARDNEVPVGAVITRGAIQGTIQGSRQGEPQSGVQGGEIIAEAANQVESRGQAILHAEIIAIQSASRRLQTKFLTDCTLWVTLEPCPMCAAAIAHARLGRLIFGASDPKSGGVLFGPQIFDHPTCHHRPEVGSGIGAAQSETLLKTFFAQRRSAVTP